VTGRDLPVVGGSSFGALDVPLVDPAGTWKAMGRLTGPEKSTWFQVQLL